MADKLLKKKARKVAAKKVPAEAQKRVVLVGTYKGDQLTRWRGWYNYPISDEDLSRADFSLITELWLFNGTKDQKTYKRIKSAKCPFDLQFLTWDFS